ncbi:MAG: hypothetical protein IJX17_04725 [Clostridia bacterium]|nr:hypothetical protein [Clostridia bacterium]
MKLKYGNTFEINPSEVVFLFSPTIDKGAIIGVKPNENLPGQYEFDVKEYDIPTVQKLFNELKEKNIDLSFVEIVNIDDLPNKEGVIETPNVTTAVSVQVEGKELSIRLLNTMIRERDIDNYNNDNKRETLKLYNIYPNSKKEIANKKQKVEKDFLPEKEEAEIQM